ncbi:hypothetical protein EV127DRAFT_477719 [Xylaria flabelliformis]|nr:hypothetical protein EV127DRAFT_477719 [Xylaria flabelliformis]
MRPFYTFVWALVVGMSISSPTQSGSNSSIAVNNITIGTGYVNSGETTELLGIGDPCSGMGNATYELGKEYFEADCPAINDLLPDGTCDWTQKQPDQTLCAEYCQVRTTFLPMQEVPIPNTYCRGPRRCSIEAGRTLQVNSSWSGTDAEMSALKHGVSGGFNPDVETITAGAGDVTIGDGECGYFTWIGTKKTVCGSLTKATRHEPANGGSPYCHGPAETTANYCVDSMTSGPLLNPSANGHTVFVRIDCGTRAALPVEKQDALFKYDGVALPANKLDEVLQGWVRAKCSLTDNFLWLSFVMHGRGLKDADLGTSGSNLLGQLRSCHAAVTDWKFDYTPTDNNFDWKASGSVDTFSLQCPGIAIKAVGANDRDGC